MTDPIMEEELPDYVTYDHVKKKMDHVAEALRMYGRGIHHKFGDDVGLRIKEGLDYIADTLEDSYVVYPVEFYELPLGFTLNVERKED